MNINAGTARACGFFKLSKGKIDPETGQEIVLEETPMFQNLVLDSGIRRMNNNKYFRLNYLVVGTGNSEPDPSQTKLDNQVARSPISSEYGEESSYGNVKIIDDNYWCVEYSSSTRFRSGTFNNVTLAEVGLTNDGVLWNRTLIKDEQGQPTTITVLSEEYLDVYYVYRYYFPRNPTITNVNIKNKAGEIVKTLEVKSYFGYTDRTNGDRFSDRIGPFMMLRTIISSEYNIPEKGPWVVTKNNNEGYFKHPNGGGRDNTVYNENGIVRKFKVNYSSEIDNINLYGFVMSDYNGNNRGYRSGLGIVIKFSEPIIKKSSETMEFDYIFKWDRYEPTPDEVPTV